MKSVILVLMVAAVASGTTPRDKRSYAHTQAYPIPVSVHTVVRPSNTLPIVEYPESTQIDKHFRNVYSVSVPITHTVTLEQPGHTRQTIYHTPPVQNTVYHAPTVSNTVYQAPTVPNTVYQPQVYTPQVYQPEVYHAPVVYHEPEVYHEPAVYHAPRTVIRRIYTPSQPWVYRRYGSAWC